MPCRSATSARYARQHDVGSPRELVDDGPAFVGRHVEGDALLALERLDGADLGEGQDRAERIAVERLDLDHPGAEVGEERRAERGRVVPAELEHGHAVERRVRGRALAVVRVGSAGPQSTSTRSLAARRRCSSTAGADRSTSAGVAFIRTIAAGWRTFPRCRVVEEQDLVVVLHLRVVEELGAATEALAPHVGVVVEDLLPLRERLLTCGLDHQLPHRGAFVGVLELGYLAPLRVVEHPVEPEGAQEGAEEARRRLRELHPVAVGRQEHGEPEVETGRGDATTRRTGERA